jgi:hypothetical protein
MYHRKMEKQTLNVKSVKTPMLPELSDDNKRLQPLPQVRAYNRLTPDKSVPTQDKSIPMPHKPTPTPGNKHLWYQLPHSSNSKMIHLMPIDCMCEISLGTLRATDSKFTTHHKPTCTTRNYLICDAFSATFSENVMNVHCSPKHCDDFFNSSRFYDVFHFFVTDVH